MITKKDSPGVLILSFQNFTSIAHIPKYLTDAGFKVAALCPGQSHLSQTKYLEEVFVLPKYFLYWLIRKRFLEVVAKYRPTLLFPGDDVARAFLENLLLQTYPDGDKYFLELIEHSLGTPEHYRSCTDKAIFGGLCKELDLPAPEQFLCKNVYEVMANAARLSYPLVFKKTLSCGGLGVEVCENEQELRRHAGNFFGDGAMSLKDNLYWEVHMARGADLRHLMYPQEESVLIQEFIPGRVLSHTFACWNGEYLSGFTYENLNTPEAITSPCRKLRVIESHYDCEAFAKRLSSELKLTGFGCMDFIKTDSGELLILECNARVTHSAILGKSVGIDLMRLLFEREALDTDRVKERVFSLFPDAMAENPSQFESKSALIPWDDKALMISFMKGSHPGALSKKWLAKMIFPWIQNRWLAYINRGLKFKQPEMFRVHDREGAMA